MKIRNLIYLIISVLILIPSCTPAESPPTTTLAPPAPAPPTLTSVPPTPTVTLTPTSAPTPKPPTSTPTPFPPFRDDFNQLLEEGWTWIREPRFGWNLHERPGFLRIEVDSRAGFENHGLLLRHAPEGDFEISTRVLFTPYANFQMAGLVIYQDDKNALYTHRGMCYIPGATHVCVGNGIYFNLYNRDEGVSEEGYQIGSSFPTKTIEKSEAYLRLTREGRTYTAYYSDDGETWVTIGKHEADLFPFYVGLLAIGAQTNPADADFDYFTLKTLP